MFDRVLDKSLLLDYFKSKTLLSRSHTLNAIAAFELLQFEKILASIEKVTATNFKKRSIGAQSTMLFLFKKWSKKRFDFVFFLTKKIDCRKLTYCTKAFLSTYNSGLSVRPTVSPFVANRPRPVYFGKLVFVLIQAIGA